MATDTTFLLAQTVISNGTYTGNSWLNPDELLDIDGNFASSNAASLLGSDVVLGNFLFNIPQNSIILGIEVSFTGYRDAMASPATVLDIYAFDNTTGGTFFYQLLPTFSSFTTAPVTYFFGSPSYLFNTTWTVDQINNLKLRLQANGLLYVEGVQVRVTYVPPSSGTPPAQDVCGSLFQGQPFSLVAPVSTNGLDVSWLVDRFQTSDGVDITNADVTLPGIPITVDQGNANEENAYVVAIAPTAGNQRILTVSRGWSMRDPVVQDATLYRQHTGGAEVVLSNSVPFYDVFLRKCHIGSLVSAPISTFDEGALITSYSRSYDFVGGGVFATGVVNGTGGKDITVTIPGFSTSPPTIVTSGSGTSGGVQVNTISDPNVVSTGTDRLLYVSVTLESTQTLTGITFNGDALTFRAARNEGDVRVEVWTRTAPDLGTNALVINTTGLTYLAWEWCCFNGVDQTTPWTAGSTNGGNTNISTGSATTVTDNAIVMHAAGTKLIGVGYTAGAGESIIASSLTGAVQGAIQSQYVGTAALVTSNINFSSVTDWANVLSSINGITPPPPIVSPVEIQDEGVTIEPNVAIINFVGAGVTATLAAPNEVTVTIPGGGTDELVKVSAADTTAGYLQPKINIHSSDGSVTVTETITNPGANEVLDIDLTGAGGGSGGGGGDFTFISNIDIAEALPNNTITKIAEFPGLTGDTEDEYIIEYEYALDGDASGIGLQAMLMLRINDVAGSNYDYSNLYMGNGVAITNNDTAGASHIALVESQAGFICDAGMGKVQIKASKTIAGIVRRTISDTTAGVFDIGAGAFQERGSGVWADTTNEIISLQLYFIQASGGVLNIEGKATLYKINRTAGTSSFTVNADESDTSWVTYQIDSPSGAASPNGPWTFTAASMLKYGNGTVITGNPNIRAYLTNGFFDSVLNTTNRTVQWNDNRTIKVKFSAASITPSGTAGTEISSFAGFGVVGTNFGDITVATEYRVGFAFYNGNIYAVASDFAAVTATLIGAYTDNLDQYVIVLNGTTDAEFYINGILVATVNTNLPTAAQDVSFGFGGRNVPGGSSGFNFASNLVISQKTS